MRMCVRGKSRLSPWTAGALGMEDQISRKAGMREVGRQSRGCPKYEKETGTMWEGGCDGALCGLGSFCFCNQCDFSPLRPVGPVFIR